MEPGDMIIPVNLIPRITDTRPLPRGFYFPGMAFVESRRQFNDRLMKDIDRHRQAMHAIMEGVSDVCSKKGFCEPLPAKTPGKRRAAKTARGVSPKKMILDTDEATTPERVSIATGRPTRHAALKATTAMTELSNRTKPRVNIASMATTGRPVSKSRTQKLAASMPVSIVKSGKPTPMRGARKLSTHSKNCTHSPANKFTLTKLTASPIAEHSKPSVTLSVKKTGCYDKVKTPVGAKKVPMFASTPAHVSVVKKQTHATAAKRLSRSRRISNRATRPLLGLKLRKSKGAFKRVYREADNNSPFSSAMRDLQSKTPKASGSAKQQAVAEEDDSFSTPPTTLPKKIVGDSSTVKKNDLREVAITSIPPAPQPPMPAGFEFLNSPLTKEMLEKKLPSDRLILSSGKVQNNEDQFIKQPTVVVNNVVQNANERLFEPESASSGQAETEIVVDTEIVSTEPKRSTRSKGVISKDLEEKKAVVIEKPKRLTRSKAKKPNPKESVLEALDAALSEDGEVEFVDSNTQNAKEAASEVVEIDSPLRDEVVIEKPKRSTNSEAELADKELVLEALDDVEQDVLPIDEVAVKNDVPTKRSTRSKARAALETLKITENGCPSASTKRKSSAGDSRVLQNAKLSVELLQSRRMSAPATPDIPRMERSTTSSKSQVRLQQNNTPARNIDDDESRDIVPNTLKVATVQCRDNDANTSSVSLFEADVSNTGEWATFLDDSTMDDQSLLNESCRSLGASSMMQQAAASKGFHSAETNRHRSKLGNLNCVSGSFLKSKTTPLKNDGNSSLSADEKREKTIEKWKKEAERVKERQEKQKAMRQEMQRKKEERRAQVKANKESQEEERKKLIAARLEQNSAASETWRKQAEMEKKKLLNLDQKKKLMEEDARRKKKEEEEEARKLLEEERLKKEDAEVRKRREELRKQREEAERLKKEADEKKRLEIETMKKRENAERQKREDALEMQRQAEIERKKKEEALERKRKEEIERKVQEEAAEKRRLKEEAERKRQAELKKKILEEDAERKRMEELERKRRDELAEKKKKEEEMERKRREEAAASAKSAYAKMMIPPCPPPNKPPPVPGCNTRSSDDHYSIDDLHSDSDTDTEGSPKKKVPTWASNAQLVNIFSSNMRCSTSWWHVWRPSESIPVDLRGIFKTSSKKSFSKRTSSAIWRTPPGKLHFK